MYNSQIFQVFFFQKQQQHKTYNSNKNFVYELKFISGHLVIHRLHFTPECRIGDPEQRRTEHSRAMLDHTGSQAVLLYSTPSTPWLQLLCPVSCVHTFMCMCVCTYPLHIDLSCPYLYAGLPGKADLSPEATSKRPGMGCRCTGC